MTEPAATRTRTETRTRILAAAGQLFDRFGPLKTTIADIARACEMSPANIYNFFKSRDEIIEAVGEIHLADLRHTLVRGLAQTSGSWNGICYMFLENARHVRRHLANEKDLLRLQLLVRQNEWQFVQRFHAFLRARLEQLLREGIASQEFGDLDPVAASSALFDCMVNAVDPLLILRCDPHRLDRQLRAQLNLLRQALR